MGTFETIGFGFDIATAISVIGAAFAFILSTRRENKKQLQNEKVTKVLDILEEFREKHLDGFFNKIRDNASNPGQLLTGAANFLRVEMFPVFAIFSTKENIYELCKMIDETDKAIDACDDFCDIKNKDTKANDAFTEAMNQYSVSMLKLDVKLTENLRNQVHNENKTLSKEIAELYQKRKYFYREVEFK